MAKTNVKKLDTNASAAEREVPEVKRECVQFNMTGHSFRHALVRMPEGLVSDDLRNPKIWRLVQKSPYEALIKLDHLLIFGHDESWGAEAIVKHATSTEASLCILKVFAFREADQALFSDGTLEVFWDGGAYGVRRVKDQVRMISDGFATEGLAIAALQRSYPTKVVA